MSDLSQSGSLPESLQAALARTPARVLVGRSGSGYRTETWLRLREDHAAARDAVHAEVDLGQDFGIDRVLKHELFDVSSQATSKLEYLQRPDLGRQLSDESRTMIQSRCPAGRDFQVVIGDGLSAAAVALQAPNLLDHLCVAAHERGWSCGRPFLVHYCRVGVMNVIGDILDSQIVVLLIGERPGLATAESLSAYMAYRPRSGHTDAQRNLISNIHPRGVGIEEATVRIMGLAEQYRRLGKSGIEVKETLVGDGRVV
jgi:ethanolamine ammonia-lyase small subunit